MDNSKHQWRAFYSVAGQGVTSKMYETQKAVQHQMRTIDLPAIDPKKRVRFFLDWSTYMEREKEADFHNVFIQRCWTEDAWKKWGNRHA